MSAGTLWVVATPIGNLEDISLRALRILGEVAVIACEDTRLTRRLLDRHRISTRMLSCHEHNEAARATEIASRLAAGEDVALVSDAGTPLLSDPGRRVVEAAIAAGAAVVPVPGASALLAALVVSGLATERFTFFGFPPVRGGARERFLAEVAASSSTAVLYEAPHRIARTLADLAKLAPERRASLHRELTKLHEETLRGTVAELAALAAERPPRGEICLVVAAAEAAAPGGSLERAVERARELIAAGATASAAAREAAAGEKVGRRDVYRALVE